MMFAKREDLDILNDNQLVMILVEHCTVDKVPYIFFVSLRKEHHSLSISLRRTPKSFSFRVLANALQNCLHRTG